MLDETALAACMASVDLNPIRAGAGIAKTPETSDFTSVNKRVADRQSSRDVSAVDARDARIEHGPQAGWLAPVPLDPPRKKVREKRNTRRASNKGCLTMLQDQYLQLLDWTGRQLRSDKRGSIPQGLDPGMMYLPENAFINVRNSSFDHDAQVDIRQDANNGVLLAQGGNTDPRLVPGRFKAPQTSPHNIDSRHGAWSIAARVDGQVRIKYRSPASGTVESNLRSSGSLCERSQVLPQDFRDVSAVLLTQDEFHRNAGIGRRYEVSPFSTVVVARAR